SRPAKPLTDRPLPNTQPCAPCPAPRSAASPLLRTPESPCLARKSLQVQMLKYDSLRQNRRLWLHRIRHGSNGLRCCPPHKHIACVGHPSPVQVWFLSPRVACVRCMILLS